MDFKVVVMVRYQYTTSFSLHKTFTFSLRLNSYETKGGAQINTSTLKIEKTKSFKVFSFKTFADTTLFFKGETKTYRSVLPIHLIHGF